MDEVKKIINEWDPIGLLTHAPEDEYKQEIKKVSEVCKIISNADELGKEIQKIFISAFGDDVFKHSAKECFEVAKKILSKRDNKQGKEIENSLRSL